jgi:radical SAM superfamily enzyme YgiQ (UPF0313 family)
MAKKNGKCTSKNTGLLPSNFSSIEGLLLGEGFQIILTADRSQMSNYRGNFLFGFLSCGPYKEIPSFAYERLLCPTVEYDKSTGKAKVAPLGLRRVESSLITAFGRGKVFVAHPQQIEKAIGEKTRVVALSEMDPLGIGPVSTAMSPTLSPFSRFWFTDLTTRLKILKRKYDFKVVLGGAGAWQLTQKQTRQEHGIDYVVDGEADSAAGPVFSSIMKGSPDEYTRVKTSTIDEVPLIQEPTTVGMIEIMRGCGRNCDFCAPNLRVKREFPIERIQKEAMVNIRHGFASVWLHAEDILLYGCDNGDMIPNRDAIVELFQGIKSLPNVRSVGATHWTLAGVVADAKVIADLAKINHLGRSKWTAVQVGLETAAVPLVRKHLSCKTRPFAPEEYPWLIREGTRIMNENHYYPAYTLIIGLPGERDEDVQDTIQMVRSLEKEDCILAPLLYVDYGNPKTSMTFEAMSAKQWELFCLCWFHNLRQIDDRILGATANFDPVMRAVTLALAKWGTKRVFQHLTDVTRTRLRLMPESMTAY